MRRLITHIHVLLDRTGSMSSIRDDVIGGFNAFVEQQREAPGLATLTLVQFDSIDPYEVVYRRLPIDRVPRLSRETFVPRASTPLLDAIGRGIVELDTTLSRLEPVERPDRVLFVIVTDGHENSSREYTYERIEQMIRAHARRDDWDFVFLGADLDAIADASRIGIDASATLAFDADAHGTHAAWKSLSSAVTRARSQPRGSVAFSEADRASQRISKRARGGRRRGKAERDEWIRYATATPPRRDPDDASGSSPE